MRTLSDIVYNQNPLMLLPSISVKEACEQMRSRRAGSVVIANESGYLVGIFTGRDAVCRVLAAGKNAETTKLAEVMTPAPMTMSSKKTAIDALRLMWDGGFRHVPVVETGKVIGVVSRGDFKGDEQTRLDEERALWEQMRAL